MKLLVLFVLFCVFVLSVVSFVVGTLLSLVYIIDRYRPVETNTPEADVGPVEDPRLSYGVSEDSLPSDIPSRNLFSSNSTTGNGEMIHPNCRSTDEDVDPSTEAGAEDLPTPDDSSQFHGDLSDEEVAEWLAKWGLDDYE